MMQQLSSPTTLYSLRQLRRNPLEFFTELAQTQGDLAHFSIGKRNFYLLNHPDLVRDMLITHDKSLQKGRMLQQTKMLLGNGLLTSEGALHLRQRRLMQPAFHQRQIDHYAAVMVHHASALSAHWQDGATVAISADLQAILLPIVAETLFDSNVQADVETVRTALAAILPLLPMLMLPGSDLWMKLPTPRMKQALAAIKTLDQLVFGLIKSRQRDGLRGDLLSMLLAAQDEQGGMSLQQVRDEVLTLLLAGHETTVNALTWTFFLLSQHPEVEAQLHDELDRVLKQRAPSLADIAKLPYTRMVLQESLRLYPPAWAIGRQVMRDIDLGGRVIATDSTLFVSQWVMHRDARYYHNPGCFDPQRWSAEQSQTRPKFAYFPFGAGSRFCIGERFAWLEMSLILATLAQAWQLRAIEPEKVEPLPRITLRPKTFLQMQLIRRV